MDSNPGGQGVPNSLLVLRADTEPLGASVSSRNHQMRGCALGEGPVFGRESPGAEKIQRDYESWFPMAQKVCGHRLHQCPHSFMSLHLFHTLGTSSEETEAQRQEIMERDSLFTCGSLLPKKRVSKPSCSWVVFLSALIWCFVITSVGMRRSGVG